MSIQCYLKKNWHPLNPFHGATDTTSRCVCTDNQSQGGSPHTVTCLAAITPGTTPANLLEASISDRSLFPHIVTYSFHPLFELQ